jgi:hypothetical protein
MSVASENGRNRIMIYGPKSRKCHLTASHRGATTSSVPGAVLFDDFGFVCALAQFDARSNFGKSGVRIR